MQTLRSFDPYFSVIIPTYNSSNYILNTLNSVLGQTYNNYEIIISDDGSTDNTVDIIKNIIKKNHNNKIKLIMNKHHGPGYSRNRGIKKSKGLWIAFLDSDDIWEIDKLESVKKMINNKNVNIICHAVKCYTGNINYKFVPSKHYLNMHPFISLYRVNPLVTSAICVNKEFLLKTTLFDEKLLSAQDYDLWLKLSMEDQFKLGFIDNPLGNYITREGNISSNFDERLKCLLIIGKRYMPYLKKISKLYFIEYLKYKSKAYIDIGYSYLLNKSFIRSTKLLITGFFLWPFNIVLLKKIFFKK
tara:strand:+ start:4255 stop:5157 length:903 start_codon:yes stop_codon:yes gene_type:complete